MDKLIKAFSEKSRIRFTAVDVTQSAKALEARHLAGPTAAMALAEGLVGVAMLSQDAAGDDEATLLRLNASGPIGGLTVEAMGDGGLRGYTNVKILNDLDGREEINTDEAWGESGAVVVQTSVPGRLLNQAQLRVSPLKIKFVLARCFNQSLQVPTACEIRVRATSGGVLSARGVLAQRMADTDMPAFVNVLEKFEDGSVGRSLEDGVDDWRQLFGLPDIEERETRDLFFKCRCSRERTLAALKTLAPEELDAMAAKGEPQAVVCHMCGETYYAAPEDIRRIADGIRSGK